MPAEAIVSLDLAAVESARAARPPGYCEDLLRVGRVEGGTLRIGYGDLVRIRRSHGVRTAGRATGPGEDLAARLRLARCAGCEDRVEGWQCGPQREQVTPCSSCVRMAYGGGRCPLGRWPR